MTKVWKLPAGTDIEGMKLKVGLSGCTYLNPIQDINDNWVVTENEYNNPDFQYLKEQYPDIANNMELIDYEPKPVTAPF